MCAGIAAGVYRDFIQAVGVFSRVEYTCTPNPNAARVYQQKFALYQKLSRLLDDTWKEWETVFRNLRKEERGWMRTEKRFQTQ